MKKSTDTRLSRKRERQKQARWKTSPFLNSLSSQEREEAKKARGEEVVVLAARQKSFLHRVAPEIFGQPIQLVHEKIDKDCKLCVVRSPHQPKLVEIRHEKEELERRRSLDLLHV